MLAVVCYVFAFALLALAAILPAAPRDRMAFAGLALFVLPTMLHALQAH